VTTLPRTVVDLADVLTFDELRAFADRGARLDERAIRAAMARHPGRRGAPDLKRLVGDGDLRTRSWLERRMRSLCREHGLPLPRVNEELLGLEVDFHWPEHRLIAEADGHAHHAHRAARARDHRRDARLQAHGWRVLRFLWDDLEHAPQDVARRLAAFLAPVRGIA
jgi:very-short-patch-repair endonuclease